MTDTKRKDFLTKEVFELLKNLNPNTKPNFGIMTPQHMVEHLTWITKSSVKRYGEPENPPTEKQLKFQKFIEKGAIFKHYPKDKTKDDLPALKYNSFEEALSKLREGAERFYNHFETNPDYKSYSPFMGELGFEELELFHYSHWRYHCWQFGLIESYASVK